MTEFTADEFTVIRATPDDWRVVRAVRLRALAADPYAFGSTLARESAYDEERWRSWVCGAATFLALVDREPVAIAGGYEADDHELVAVWADPRVRGTGAGEAVVTAVADWAGRRGAPRLTAWALETNHRALAFYRRLGFTATGRDDDHPHDPALRELELELAL